MTDIYERFLSLPRGRRGTEVIVIVPEAELAALIGDAQASEATLVQRTRIAQVAADTPANEQRLTPLPLDEQRPGAWNFREPIPTSRPAIVNVICEHCHGLGGEHYRGCHLYSGV